MEELIKEILRAVEIKNIPRELTAETKAFLEGRIKKIETEHPEAKLALEKLMFDLFG